MPPKKLNKKQLEKQKAELEAQLAAERAAAECASASEAERLRIVGEDQARNRAEAEKLRRVDEALRLKKEDEDFTPFKTHRSQQVRESLAELVELIDWGRYKSDSVLPNPADEKELNSMMSEWVAMSSNDPLKLLESVEVCAQVMQRMLLRVPELADEAKLSRAHFYVERMHAMQLENTKRIEQATALTLQKLESFANKEREVKHVISSPNSAFCIWANLVPNGKIPRMLEIEELNISFDLPKMLSRNAFAVRCLQTTFDHICIEGNMPDHDDKRSIGGVLCFEFYALPPMERPALHWRMQHLPIDFIDTAVLNHTNGPVVTNDGLALELPQATALHIKFRIEPHILMRQPYSVAWWDHKAKKWSSLGVSDVLFNDATREVSCESVVFSPLACVQSKSMDIPYRSWFLAPTALNEAMLTIEMRTHTLKIRLTQHMATLIQPDLPELSEIFMKPLPPSSLAAALSRSGFTVFPCDADIEHVDALVPKEPSVERQLHEDMSMLVQGFAFQGSVWNQAAGRNKCTVQLAEKPDYEISPMIETYNTLIHMWENEAMKIANLNCTESAQSYKESFGETHLRMEHLLRDEMPDQCSANIKDSSVKFQECVRHMLDAVRLFSFC